jgi:chromosomal replication initiation ATPase DnaA
VLTGKIARPWQDTSYVLSQFGRNISEARRNLQRAILQEMSKGRNPELTGGGLIRSAGGWRAVREAYRQGTRLVSDERILGSSEFVETVLKSAGDAYERRTRMRSAGIDLDTLIDCACHHLGIAEKELSRPGRMRAIARARALIGYIAVTELAIPASEVARRMNVDRSSICRAIQRVGQNEKMITAAMEIIKLAGMRLGNNATTSL